VFARSDEARGFGLRETRPTYVPWIKSASRAGFPARNRQTSGVRVIDALSISSIVSPCTRLGKRDYQVQISDLLRERGEEAESFLVLVYYVVMLSQSRSPR